MRERDVLGDLKATENYRVSHNVSDTFKSQ